MIKSILILSILIISVLLFGAYDVGDIVDNYYWTDNTGADHDSYELTSQGVAIVFFWGFPG